MYHPCNSNARVAQDHLQLLRFVLLTINSYILLAILPPCMVQINQTSSQAWKLRQFKTTTLPPGERLNGVNTRAAPVELAQLKIFHISHYHSEKNNMRILKFQRLGLCRKSTLVCIALMLGRTIIKKEICSSPPDQIVDLNHCSGRETDNWMTFAVIFSPQIFPFFKTFLSLNFFQDCFFQQYPNFFKLLNLF